MSEFRSDVPETSESVISAVSGAEGRGPGLRKENPRPGYAVWETKTRESRLRQLPTDPLSCGTQPAYMRLIIVAAATPRPSALFTTGMRKGTKWRMNPRSQLSSECGLRFKVT
jgi:hypothetical protein